MAAKIPTGYVQFSVKLPIQHGRMLTVIGKKIGASTNAEVVRRSIEEYYKLLFPRKDT